jgi:hypothetical protein
LRRLKTLRKVEQGSTVFSSEDWISCLHRVQNVQLLRALRELILHAIIDLSQDPYGA